MAKKQAISGGFPQHNRGAGRRSALSHFLIALAVLASLFLASAAEARDRAPLNRDGWRHGVIFNGKQNMPVILPGAARDWANGWADKKARDCRKLAEAFTNGHGDIRPNMRIAVGYWLAACRAGDGSAWPSGKGMVCRSSYC